MTTRVAPRRAARSPRHSTQARASAGPSINDASCPMTVISATQAVIGTVAVGMALSRILRKHEVCVVTSVKEALDLIAAGEPFDAHLLRLDDAANDRDRLLRRAARVLGSAAWSSSPRVHSRPPRWSSTRLATSESRSHSRQRQYERGFNASSSPHVPCARHA